MRLDEPQFIFVFRSDKFTITYKLYKPTLYIHLRNMYVEITDTYYLRIIFSLHIHCFLSIVTSISVIKHNAILYNINSSIDTLHVRKI